MHSQTSVIKFIFILRFHFMHSTTKIIHWKITVRSAFDRLSFVVFMFYDRVASGHYYTRTLVSVCMCVFSSTLK